MAMSCTGTASRSPRRALTPRIPEPGPTSTAWRSSIQVRPISRVRSPRERAHRAGTLPPSRNRPGRAWVKWADRSAPGAASWRDRTVMPSGANSSVSHLRSAAMPVAVGTGQRVNQSVRGRTACVMGDFPRRALLAAPAARLHRPYDRRTGGPGGRVGEGAVRHLRAQRRGVGPRGADPGGAGPGRRRSCPLRPGGPGHPVRDHYARTDWFLAQARSCARALEVLLLSPAERRPPAP